MKSLNIPIVAVCMLILVAAHPTRSAGQITQSCLIKVSCDPLVLPMEANALQALLNTTGVANQAARETFEVQDCAAFRGRFQVRFAPISGSAAGEPAPSGAIMRRSGTRGAGTQGGFMGASSGGSFPDEVSPHTVRAALPSEMPPHTVFGLLEVIVDGDDLADGLDRLLTAVCDRLRNVLVETHHSEMEQLAARVAVAEEEATRARRRMEELYQQRRQNEHEAGGEILTRESVMERSRGLHTEMQKLEMELAGMQARREALQQRIAEATARVQATVSDEHPMMQAHKAKLAALRDQLKHLEARSEAGTAPTSEVMTGKANLAMAEAELQHQLDQVKAQAGGEQIGVLNDQLAGLSVETTEREARLRFLKAELNEAREALARADEYDIPMTIELPLARQFYEFARIRLEEFQRQARTIQPPVVTVIGGP